MSHPDDQYKEVRAELRLHDLPPRDDSLPIKLSVMMSTCYRYSQLERSLECLARQDWKEFEVLICDDGDTSDINPIIDQFHPFLRIKKTRREKEGFSVDPSGGFMTLFPLAQGEYWAIMQPELMLYPDACRLLYEGHIKPLSPELAAYNPRTGESNTFIQHNEIDGRKTWVTLKSWFLSSQMTQKLDRVDWHSDLNNVKNLRDFWLSTYGFAYKMNAEWSEFLPYPWWFCASGHRRAGIFQDMQAFRGHAMIDFYTIGYRRFYDYVDVIIKEPRAIHQDHVRIAVGVPGEFNDFTTFPVPDEWK